MREMPYLKAYTSNGRRYFYFRPSTWMRQAGLKSQRLSDDEFTALREVAALLEGLEAHRRGRIPTLRERERNGIGV